MRKQSEDASTTLDLDQIPISDDRSEDIMMFVSSIRKNIRQKYQKLSTARDQILKSEKQQKLREKFKEEPPSFKPQISQLSKKIFDKLIEQQEKDFEISRIE